MREWDRTSQEILVDEFPPGPRAAMQEHIEHHHLNLTLDAPVMIVKTVSRRIKKGLFTPKPKQVESFVVLLGRWLLWTVSSDGEPPAVFSARVADLSFDYYVDNPMFSEMEENGLPITGKLTGMVGQHGQEQVSMFIGLGDEPVADKLRMTVMGFGL